MRYIPRNHEVFLWESAGASFGGVELEEQAIHESADGRRYLVLHGDRFDMVATYTPRLARLGAAAYRAVLAANISLNRARCLCGLPYWSLSAWAKPKIKGVANFISDYETRIAAEARHLDVHGSRRALRRSL